MNDRRKSDPYIWLNFLMVTFLGAIGLLYAGGSLYLKLKGIAVDGHGDNAVFSIIGVFGGALTGAKIAANYQSPQHTPVNNENVETQNVISSPEDTEGKEKTPTE